MKNNFLSICIPTYNRPETLAKLLHQLSSELLIGVEIRISDDASPDRGQTEKMVKKFITSGLPISYSRNKKNLGYSLNVKKLYESAKGEYVWFLCDDDEIEPGAVRNIILKLKKYSPSVAIFNCLWTDSFGRIRQAWPHNDSLITDLSGLDSYQPIMRTIFLSIGVYKRSKQKIDIPNNTVKDNIFIQLTIALHLLSQKLSLAQFGDLVVKRKVGYKYGEFIKFNLTDHFKAVSAVTHIFDINKFISWSYSMFPSFMALYLSQKIGLFTYSGSPSGSTIYLFKKYYGLPRYYIFKTIKIISNIIPNTIFKLCYLLVLLKIHHPRKGLKIYYLMVNRAYQDKRNTLFNTYS